MSFISKIIIILKNPRLMFITILILAGFFRLSHLNLIEFKFDEALNVYQLTEFYRQPTLATHSGLSSSGMHNFPLLHYLLIILGIFSQHPQYLSFLIALINTILVGIFYLIIKKFFGNITGLFSAAILATSPWAILYSRKIWHPDLILLFAIPAFYFTNQLITQHKKNPKLIFWLFALLFLLCQQHFSGFYYLIITILILLVTKTPISLKAAILGSIIGLLPALPYLFFNLTSIPFCPDCQAFFTYQQEVKNFDLANFYRPFQIINGLYFEDALGYDWLTFLKQFPPVNYFNLLFWLEMALPVAGAFYVFRQKNYHWLFIYWLIPLIYFISKTPARMYYFVILLPIIALFYGLGSKFLWNLSKNKLLKIVIIFIAVLVISANLIFENDFINFLSDKQNINGNYGSIFTVTEKFIDEQTSQYKILPNYQQIKNYAYVFAKPEILHSRLGEFFLQNQHFNLASDEYKKALQVNQDDLNSLANLTYIYILNKNFNEAKQNLNIIAIKNSTLSAQLSSFLQQQEKNYSVK